MGLQALREANRSGEAMLATQYDSKEKDVQTKLAAVKQELEELERANQLALQLKEQAMVAKEKEMLQLQRAGSEANLENKQQQEAERQALEAEFAAMQLAKEQELERVRQEAEDKAKALEEEKAAP